MSVLDSLKNIRLVYFSKPKSQRPLYRAARKNQTASILELGISDQTRSLRLISLAVRLQGDASRVSYTAIDPFDSRSSDREPLSLKQTHQRLAGCGVRIQLVPGDPCEGLARTANTLLGTDLIIINRHCDLDPCSRVWFYFPRMLHTGTSVFREQAQLEEGQGEIYHLIPRAEIDRLAGNISPRRVA